MSENKEEQCESLGSKPKIWTGEEINRVEVDGPQGNVREVRIILKDDHIILFEPSLRVWDRGIDSYIKERTMKIIGRGQGKK